MKKHNVRRLLVLVLVVALLIMEPHMSGIVLPSPTPKRSTSTLPMTLCS